MPHNPNSNPKNTLNKAVEHMLGLSQHFVKFLRNGDWISHFSKVIGWATRSAGWLIKKFKESSRPRKAAYLGLLAVFMFYIIVKPGGEIRQEQPLSELKSNRPENIPATNKQAQPANAGSLSKSATAQKPDALLESCRRQLNKKKEQVSISDIERDIKALKKVHINAYKIDQKSRAFNDASEAAVQAYAQAQTKLLGASFVDCIVGFLEDSTKTKIFLMRSDNETGFESDWTSFEIARSTSSEQEIYLDDVYRVSGKASKLNCAVTITWKGGFENYYSLSEPPIKIIAKRSSEGAETKILKKQFKCTLSLYDAQAARL